MEMKLEKIVKACRNSALSNTPVVKLNSIWFEGVNFQDIIIDLNNPISAFEESTQNYRSTNEITLILSSQHFELLRWNYDKLMYRVISWSHVQDSYVLNSQEDQI